MKSLSERIRYNFYFLWEYSTVRYLFVGGTLTLIDFSVFFSLVNVFSFDIRLAQVISRTIASVVGFCGHKFISFRSRSMGSILYGIEEGMKFFALTIINIFISPFILQITVFLAGGNVPVGKVLAEIFIAAETYIILRLIFLKRRGIHNQRLIE